MALEGKLSDFGFTEILQLIETQQKSGFLRIFSRVPMAFLFEQGTLISTRDRSSEAADPLERYLRRYGFFNRAQWKHIEFIKQNSSLDLTEILVSEQLVDEEQLRKLLESLAQEMAHTAMKTSHGDFVFTPVRDPSANLRGRMEFGVQGLLMEAARRLDEEKQLKEIFPSPQTVFRRGSGTPDTEQMSETGRRLFKMALAGQPLGRIIGDAQTDSFTTRSLLNMFCQEDLLVAVSSEQSDGASDRASGRGSGRRFLPFLRSPLLTLVAIVALGAIGYLRWQPIILGEGPDAGLFDQADGVVSVDLDQEQNRQLRLRQLRRDVRAALDVFRYRHGHYPVDLAQLVTEAILPVSTYRTAVELNWLYTPSDKARTYNLRS